MTTMHADVLTKLKTATSAILTGGIFTSDDIDKPSGGGLQWAKDNNLLSSTLVLTAHGILRWKDSSAYQTDARHLRAEMATAELYIYAHFGQYALLETAIKPIQDAFPVGLVYTADDRDLYDVMQIEAFGEMPVEEYQRRPSRMLRLQIIHKRK